VARKWEGDLYFVIQPEGKLSEQVVYYLDLWHGKCRGTEIVADLAAHRPAFTLRAGYHNFSAILQGRLDPMQAMLTRRLDVKGSMAYMMRNVPTVLDFVRCAREVLPFSNVSTQRHNTHSPPALRLHLPACHPHWRALAMAWRKTGRR
jgi:putative sterol carrier protein